MARFNKGTLEAQKTENFAGGQAYVQSDKAEFVSILLTSLVQDQFYRSAEDTMNRVSELMDKIDPKFAAKAAIYTRTKFGMRSISHVVAGEIAKRVKGENWTAKFFDRVVYRPDDMMEILAYYISRYGKRPIPNALKRGFTKAFGRFDAYQIGKYNGVTREIKLIDVANLITGRKTDLLGEVVGKLSRGELDAADTWEKSLTQAGQKAENDEQKAEFKKDAWERMIKTRKIGYFALIRNLRNIMQQAPDVIDDMCKIIVDEKLIRKSMLFPFRFFVAAREIEKEFGTGKEVRKVISALVKALEISFVNVPVFDGETLVTMDDSGSMHGLVKERTRKGDTIVKSYTMANIASLFSAILVKRSNADFIRFSDHAKYVNLNPDDSILTIMDIMTRNSVPAGTNFHSIFEVANRKYDRIIVISDMQGWVGHYSPDKPFKNYRMKYKADPFVYSFDLSGYGTLQFPESKILCMAGLSDKVFDIMKLLETDRNAMVNEIERTEL